MVAILAALLAAPRCDISDAKAIDSRALVFQYAYKALAAGSSAPCAELKAPRSIKPQGGSWKDNCRAVFYELAFAQALATGSAKAHKFCVGALATDKDFASLKSSEVQDTCRLEFKPIEPFCGRLADLFKGQEPERKRLCRRFLASLTEGDAKACPDSKDAEDVEKCRAYTAFHEARAAKDPALCQGHEICLAFLGQASRISEQYAARVCP